MSKRKIPPTDILYQPKQVLTVYATNIRESLTGERTEDDQEEDDMDEGPMGEKPKSYGYYVEISDVMYDKGKSFLSPGKPLSHDTLKDLLGVVAETEKKNLATISSLAPKNLLALDQRPGRQLLAFWTPSQKRPIFHEGKKTKNLWVPPMVYIVRHNSLLVACLKKNNRPGMATELFHAPFFNVYNDARVCLGTVKPPKNITDLAEAVNAWETIFWNSEFSETVTGAYTKKQMIKWWRKPRRGKFPMKSLKRFPKTLRFLCQEK